MLLQHDVHAAAGSVEAEKSALKSIVSKYNISDDDVAGEPSWWGGSAAVLWWWGSKSMQRVAFAGRLRRGWDGSYLAAACPVALMLGRCGMPHLVLKRERRPRKAG